MSFSIQIEHRIPFCKLIQVIKWEWLLTYIGDCFKYVIK